MASTVVLITSIASFIGFTINVLVMLVILSRGRRRHHLLFALILFTAVCWDLGIFLIMIRNSFPNEIILYQNLISIPINFLPALVYHFTTTYLNQPRKKSTILIYAYCILGPILHVAGVIQPISDVYNYSWGTIGRNEPNFNNLSWFLVYNFFILFSCWLLLQARKVEQSPVTRRHIGYILASFIVFCAAQVKILVAYGVDFAFALPWGILLIASFGAVIGVAIVKHQLFDITVFVRKGLIYSALAALIIFIFDFSQHLIAAFLGGIAGENSTYVNFASIAVVVIAFMPLKKRLDHMIGGILAKKKIEF